MSHAPGEGEKLQDDEEEGEEGALEGKDGDQCADERGEVDERGDAPAGVEHAACLRARPDKKGRGA